MAGFFEETLEAFPTCCASCSYSTLWIRLGLHRHALGKAKAESQGPAFLDDKVVTIVTGWTRLTRWDYAAMPYSMCQLKMFFHRTSGEKKASAWHLEFLKFHWAFSGHRCYCNKYCHLYCFQGADEIIDLSKDGIDEKNSPRHVRTTSHTFTLRWRQKGLHIFFALSRLLRSQPPAESRANFVIPSKFALMKVNLHCCIDHAYLGVAGTHATW